jgi:hypothetical protein
VSIKLSQSAALRMMAQWRFQVVAFRSNRFLSFIYEIHFFMFFQLGPYIRFALYKYYLILNLGRVSIILVALIGYIYILAALQP